MIDSLQELYVEELKDLHSAERQIIEALPRMIKAAKSDALRDALSEHLVVTKNQLSRLDEILEGLGKKGTGKRCKDMEGILTEGKELLSEKPAEEINDTAIIAATLHVEHYEMAGYIGAALHARQLGETKAEKLLKMSLAEEDKAGRDLAQLAEKMPAAVHA
jgi:ferritin-like metal-binding protein YciE